MLRLLFTLDYEIHGNGEGCPRALMVEPTDRLLRLFDGYGAKLTIMADVAEILRFGQYRDEHGRDDYHYGAILEQLRRAVRTGHDVQLHLHSSYFNAVWHDGRWRQDWSEYDFARLPYERMHWMVGVGKRFLESLLQPVDPAYRCVAFRAANWSVSPSRHVVAALSAHGIPIDSSVFKHGRRDGLVHFDYADAPSELLPWRASAADLCRRDDAGPLWEVPIYSERRWIGAFLSPGRLYRALTERLHRTADAGRRDPARRPGLRARVKRALRPQAWKADFNQCTGRQLVRALHRAEQGHAVRAAEGAPFVLIGHSKLFTRRNEASLRPLLRHATQEAERFGFDTLRGLAPRLS